MRRFIQGLRELMGGEPKPLSRDDFSGDAKALHAFKSQPDQRVTAIAKIREELSQPEPSFTHASFRWRKWRWLSIILINFLFVASFHFDVQLVEGSLTASRFVGFHMADVNASLQVMLAYKDVVINLLIGTVTVVFLWWLVGGRTFCSWACPYHLVSEWAEMIHLWLTKRGWVRDHPLDRRMRAVLYVVFAVSALVTGYTVFETISPVGIMSRALVYGAGISLVWVGLLLLIEAVLIRRFWCRYVCPIGITYSLVGTVSPLVVEYNLEHCLHEGKCRSVCMVPHVLDMTKRNRAEDVVMHIGADCTRCGMCLETCPTGALNFKMRGTGGLL